MFSPVFVDINDTSFIYASSDYQIFVVEHIPNQNIDRSSRFGQVTPEFVKLYKKHFRMDLDTQTMLAHSSTLTYEVASPKRLFSLDAADKKASEINALLYKATECMERMFGNLSHFSMIDPILASLTKNAFESDEIPNGKVIVQDKLDGNRLLIHLGSKMAYTRNHKIKFKAELMGEIWNRLKGARNIYNLGVHVDGELYKPNGQSSDVSGRLNSLNLRFDGLCYNVFGYFDENNKITLYNMHRTLPRRLVTHENKEAMLLRYTLPDYQNMEYATLNFVYTKIYSWPEDINDIRVLYAHVTDRHYREGLMIYVGNRCYPNNTMRDCVYKIKSFDEIVLQVIDVANAKGQEEGCALFVLENQQRIRPSMTFDERREILSNPSLVIGKWGIFKYAISTDAGNYRDMTFVRWFESNDESN